MKVMFYSAKEYDKESFSKIACGDHVFEYNEGPLTETTAKYIEGCEGVCVFVNDSVNESILSSLANNGVKYIFLRNAGYNNVDLKAAAKNNIKVFRVPAYSPEGVAEMALSLMMSINRNIHIAYNRTKIKDFSLDGLQGYNIHWSTVGIIGVGRIGQCLINAVKGMGASVLVYDEYAAKNFPDTAEKLGFKYVDKETLFKASDFVSLHAPLLPETKHIVNKDMLKLMKKNAIVVNTARGGLINTEDLLWALDHGVIRGAGLDVYENEAGVFFDDHSNDLIPDNLLSRMRAHRNVILTSHQAFLTYEALDQIAMITINNIKAAESGNFDHTLVLQENGKVLNG